MYKNFFKRVLDFSISLIALLILFVPLLIVTIWLHYANGKNVNLNLNWWQRWLQPVIFTQERPGISGWAQCHGRNAISWTEKF